MSMYFNLTGLIRNRYNKLIELLTSRCNLIESSTNEDNIRIIGVTASIFIIIYGLFRLLKRKQTDDDEKTDPNLAFYRNLIPSVPDDPNLAFYSNLIPSVPEGDKIEKILTDWSGNYGLLERHHGYIQWLFPNRDPGVNPEASILTDKEAETIRESPVLRGRVKESFKMMLDFYGMKLTSNDEFELAENHSERLAVLNQWGNHNFLRISRILLALKELGHKELMLPWLKFLAELIYVEDRLDKAQSSFENYWIYTLDDSEKEELDEYMDSEDFWNKKDKKKKVEDHSDEAESSSENYGSLTLIANDGEKQHEYMESENSRDKEDNKKKVEDLSDEAKSSPENHENQTHNANDGENQHEYMNSENSGDKKDNKKIVEDRSDEAESSSENYGSPTHDVNDRENQHGDMNSESFRDKKDNKKIVEDRSDEAESSHGNNENPTLVADDGENQHEYMISQNSRDKKDNKEKEEDHSDEADKKDK